MKGVVPSSLIHIIYQWRENNCMYWSYEKKTLNLVIYLTGYRPRPRAVRAGYLQRAPLLPPRGGGWERQPVEQGAPHARPGRVFILEEKIPLRGEPQKKIKFFINVVKFAFYM